MSSAEFQNYLQLGTTGGSWLPSAVASSYSRLATATLMLQVQALRHNLQAINDVLVNTTKYNFQIVSYTVTNINNENCSGTPQTVTITVDQTDNEQC
jgi:hypothetical protein